MTLTASHHEKQNKHSSSDDALSARVDFSVDDKDGGTRFVLSGSLTVHSLNTIEKSVFDALQSARAPVVLELDELDRLDTSGALLINKIAGALDARNVEYSVHNSNELHGKLLEKSLVQEPEDTKGDNYPVLVLWFNAVGRKIYEELELLGQLIGFLGKFLLTLRYIISHPGQMRWTSLVYNMEQTGVRAVPIVSLLTFLIGMVVAYMGAQQLQRFGAQIFAVNLLEVTVLREMAVLITSIVVAGRSSSSFTAQIGAMVANEEVDAMRSMGLDPSVLLVVPRVLALVFCLPMLVFIADIMSLLGGAVAIWYTMDMSFSSFVSQFHEVSDIDNFFVGMVKTPFFALSIGLVGCFQGFRATGSAESVGMLTTVSVVESIFIVILLDALFAIFFTTLGI